MRNISTMVNSAFEELINRFHTAEEQISEQEDKSIGITQTETKRKKSRKDKTKHNKTKPEPPRALERIK